MTTTVLIDPTLRRARRARLSSLLVLAVLVGTLVEFGRGLRPEARPPLSLPSPRRALAPSVLARRGARTARPDLGQPRPESGQRRPDSGQASLDPGLCP